MHILLFTVLKKTNIHILTLSHDSVLHFNSFCFALLTSDCAFDNSLSMYPFIFFMWISQINISSRILFCNLAWTKFRYASTVSNLYHIRVLLNQDLVYHFQQIDLWLLPNTLKLYNFSILKVILWYWTEKWEKFLKFT